MGRISPDSAGLSSLQGALEVFAEYDVARLLAYWQRGDPERIAIESFGQSLALRFDEVGYFNRVYHVDEETVARLADVLAFYAGSPHDVHLVGEAGFDGWRHRDALLGLGFRPGPSYARVITELGAVRAERPPAGVEVLSKDELDAEAFLDLYLRGFGADPARVAAAKENMRLLFDVRDLHFWMGLVDGVPAGIGMLYLSGERAFLCAGATLPEYEKRGCHTALIRHRLAAAHALGASVAVSWATAGGASHRNMVAQGLATVAIDRSWERHAPVER
jgi:hypothetical protein